MDLVSSILKILIIVGIASFLFYSCNSTDKLQTSDKTLAQSVLETKSSIEHSDKVELDTIPKGKSREQKSDNSLEKIETTKLLTSINTEIQFKQESLNSDLVEVSSNGVFPDTTTDSLECDLIVLNNDKEIKANVSLVGENQVRYKKCSNLSGPDYTKPKSSIEYIEYANGSKDVFTKKTKEEKSFGATLAGFIISLAGILFLLLPASTAIFSLGFGISLAGLITSINGLVNVNKEPSKWKGKGFAIAGMIISSLTLFLLLLLIVVV